MGQFKPDVDAGYKEFEGRFSVGAVIRNQLGHICVASAKRIQNPGSVLAAELIAIKVG